MYGRFSQKSRKYQRCTAGVQCTEVYNVGGTEGVLQVCTAGEANGVRQVYGTVYGGCSTEVCTAGVLYIRHGLLLQAGLPIAGT